MLLLGVPEMDPVSLIVAALVAGASAGAGDAAKDAVASLYGRLKAAITGKAADASAVKTLERHAANPAGYEVPVQDLITESGSSDDEAILTLARDLLSKADPAGAQIGKYNVHITGGQGTVIGDGANVTQTFGSGPGA